MLLALILKPEAEAKERWRTNKTLRQPISGAVSDEGIEYAGPSAAGSFIWSSVQGYRAWGKVLVVFVPAESPLYLVAGFFTDRVAWREARTLVTRSTYCR